MGISIEGCVIYTTLEPCYTCLKLITAVNIKEIYYEYPYDSKEVKDKEFLDRVIKECGINIYQQLIIDKGTLNYVMPFMTNITSKRILSATE